MQSRLARAARRRRARSPTATRARPAARVVDRRPARARRSSTRARAVRGAESFAVAPEIAAALHGDVAAGHARTRRRSARDLLYVAVPVALGRRRHGAVRITYPTSAVDARIVRYWLVLAGDRGGRARGRRARRRSARALRHAAAARRSSAPPARRRRTATSTRARRRTRGRPRCGRSPRVFNETVARLEQLVALAGGVRRRRVAPAAHAADGAAAAARERRRRATRSREVERLGSLVEGLLALARADAGAAAAWPVDVAALVRERSRALAAARGGAGVAVAAPATDAPCSPARRPSGSPGARQPARERARGLAGGSDGHRVDSRRTAWVELRVRDEGPGMSAEERERAFDRFWRGRAAAAARARPRDRAPARRGRRRRGRARRAPGGASRRSCACAPCKCVRPDRPAILLVLWRRAR